MDSCCSGDWKDKANLHPSCSISYVTYKPFNKYPGISALTTARSSIIDSLASSNPDDILPAVIPAIMPALEMASAKFVAGRQVHSSNIADVNISARGEIGPNLTMILRDTDGLVTNTKGIVLCVLTADCLPVFLYDPVKKVAALLHAGRKGTEAGICAIGASRMVESYACIPENIIALIGISIGPCCYPVNLWEENRRQLERQGICEIYNPQICTGCHTEMFYSYRVEKGTTGRMVSALLLR